MITIQNVFTFCFIIVSFIYRPEWLHPFPTISLSHCKHLETIIKSNPPHDVDSLFQKLSPKELGLQIDLLVDEDPLLRMGLPPSLLSLIISDNTDDSVDYREAITMSVELLKWVFPWHFSSRGMIPSFNPLLLSSFLGRYELEREMDRDMRVSNEEKEEQRGGDDGGGGDRGVVRYKNYSFPSHHPILEDEDNFKFKRSPPILSSTQMRDINCSLKRWADQYVSIPKFFAILKLLLPNLKNGEKFQLREELTPFLTVSINNTTNNKKRRKKGRKKANKIDMGLLCSYLDDKVDEDEDRVDSRHVDFEDEEEEEDFEIEFKDQIEEDEEDEDKWMAREVRQLFKELKINNQPNHQNGRRRRETNSRRGGRGGDQQHQHHQQQEEESKNSLINSPQTKLRLIDEFSDEMRNQLKGHLDELLIHSSYLRTQCDRIDVSSKGVVEWTYFVKLCSEVGISYHQTLKHLKPFLTCLVEPTFHIPTELRLISNRNNHFHQPNDQPLFFVKYEMFFPPSCHKMNNSTYLINLVLAMIFSDHGMELALEIGKRTSASTTGTSSLDDGKLSERDWLELIAPFCPIPFLPFLPTFIHLIFQSIQFWSIFDPSSSSSHENHHVRLLKVDAISFLDSVQEIMRRKGSCLSAGYQIFCSMLQSSQFATNYKSSLIRLKHLFTHSPSLLMSNISGVIPSPNRGSGSGSGSGSSFVLDDEEESISLGDFLLSFQLVSHSSSSSSSDSYNQSIHLMSRWLREVIVEVKMKKGGRGLSTFNILHSLIAHGLER